MGQGQSSRKNPKITNPQTPYEYHPSDEIEVIELIDKYIEQIQPQLEADARVIEQTLLKRDSMFLYNSDTLRIHYVDTNNITHYVVLSKRFRSNILRKNIKIPFVIGNFINEGEHDTFICRVITNV